VGGLIATSFVNLETGLRWIFMFNAASKIVMLVILVVLVRETRPEAEPALAAREPRRTRSFDPSLFLNRPFLAVAAATLAISAMSAGVVQALFPVFTERVVGLAAYDIGVMLTLAGVTSMLVSFPNGWLVDRLGHRASLSSGLVVLGLSASLLAMSDSYWAAVVMVLVYGLGEGMSHGTSLCDRPGAPTAAGGVPRRVVATAKWRHDHRRHRQHPRVPAKEDQLTSTPLSALAAGTIDYVMETRLGLHGYKMRAEFGHSRT
jgi:MFS family permease